MAGGEVGFDDGGEEREKKTTLKRRERERENCNSMV